MRDKLRLWMVPLIMVAAFMLTTCVVAAFSAQRTPNEILFANTQCVYATNYYARILEDSTSEYIMDYGIFFYRDQEAEPDWEWPDGFWCTRRQVE